MVTGTGEAPCSVTGGEGFGGPAKRLSRRRGRRAGGFLRRPLGGPLQAAAAGEWPVHPARAALTRPALFPFRFPLSLLIVVAELESGVRTSDPARRSRQCFPDVFISMCCELPGGGGLPQGPPFNSLALLSASV